ncbi:MAG TPA: ABC transporter permease [Actinomycetes bacterium]|nr:ABC transporter permease [Actinomycetes bacterium]
MSAPAQPTFAPRPGAAPMPRMVARQAWLELTLMLRNGEQLVLALVIPVLVLVGVTLVDAVDLGPGRRVDIITPGVFALAVMSTAFTGQAIATGFDRRYGVLKRLGATPLPRWGLIAAKTACVLVVELGQLLVLALVATRLGWHPRGSVLDVAALLLVGTAAFSGLGLLMAGTLRAEATLAGANLVWLLLFVGGGIVVPLDQMPEGVAAGLAYLPSAALTEGLRDVLQHGASLPWPHLGVLLVWAGVGVGLASRTFRWE